MTLIHDPSLVKLGRLAKNLVTYVQIPAWAKVKTTTSAPITVPPACDWTAKAGTFPMDLNDTLGDCTIAAASHLIQTWTSNEVGGTAAVLPDAACLTAYEACSGYNGTPATDVGCLESTVLEYWQKTGIGGHKIDAYVTVDWTKQSELMETCYLFGGVYLGVALPVAAQMQSVWAVSSGADAVPGSWGLHAVPIVAYNATGVIVVTWGQLKSATWAWVAKYCDESYAILSPDWSGADPLGLSVGTLQSDLAVVQSPLTFGEWLDNVGTWFQNAWATISSFFGKVAKFLHIG